MSIPRTQAILDRYLSSQISAPIALMELLLATADADAVARAVASFGGHVAPLHGRLAAQYAAGCAVRVLRPGGDLVIFNYAYGREREADARELGEAAGLSVVRSDESPFRLCNGIAFHLSKPAGRQ